MEIEADARHGEISPVRAGAILNELTGAGDGVTLRMRIGPDAAATACLAKAVRVLASMHASAVLGMHISIAGLLDELTGDGVQAASPALRRRACLDCGETFLSDGPGNRLCETCLAGDMDDLPAV